MSGIEWHTPDAPDEDAPATQTEREATTFADKMRHGLVQAGGYCAPSAAIAELLPEVTVPRGGLTYPTAEQQAQVRLEAEAKAERMLDRRDADRRHKREVGARNYRHRQVLSVIRGSMVLLFLLVLLLAVGRALPWQ